MSSDNNVKDGDDGINYRDIKDLKHRLQTLTHENKKLLDHVGTLETRLNTEREEFLEASRLNQRLEVKIANQESKNRLLEEKVEELKSEQKSGLSMAKRKDLEIQELKGKIKSHDAITVKHREDVVQFIAEKKKLSDSNRRLEAHVKELDQAIEDLLKNNQDLTRTISRYDEKIKALNEELEREQIIRLRYEIEINKLRMNGKSQHGQQTNTAELSNVSSFSELQKELILAKNKIRELETRNERLRGYEEKAAKLEVQLSSMKKEMKMLRTELEEKEMELESNKNSVEECAYQLEDYREKLRLTTEYAEKHIKELQNQILLSTDQISELTEKNSRLELELDEERRKGKDVQNQLEVIEHGKYGLGEAAAQVRQLKTLVSVRDTFIADLINELNTYQRIITGIEKYLPDAFDFEKFVNSILNKQDQETVKYAEQKAIEIIKNSMAIRKDKKIGSIKIVVGGGTGRQKATVFTRPLAETDNFVKDDGETAEYEEDADAESESTEKARPKESKILSSLNMDVMQALSPTQDNKFAGKKTKSSAGESSAKEIIDCGTQTETIEHDTGKSADVIINIPEDVVNQDEWIRTLKDKYVEAVNENKKLKEELESISKRNEICEKENKDLSAAVDDLNKELNMISQISGKEAAISTPKKEVSSDSTSISSASTSVKKIDKLRLSMNSQQNTPHTTLGVSSVVYLGKFDVGATDLKIGGGLEFPSLQFSASYIAREEHLDDTMERLKNESRDAKTQSDELRRKVDELENRLRNSERIAEETRLVNERLQTKLTEQRNLYKEKFMSIKTEADRYIEAAIKDTMELKAIQDKNLGDSKGSYADKLEDYSLELKRKNEKIFNLEKLVHEKNEKIFELQESLDELKSKINHLETNQEKSPKSTPSYNSYDKYKEKCIRLQSVVEKLKKQLTSLKNEQSQHSTVSVEDEKPSQSEFDVIRMELSKVKKAKVKIEERNKELQSQLEKSNGKIFDLTTTIRKMESRYEKLKTEHIKLTQKSKAFVKEPN